MKNKFLPQLFIIYTRYLIGFAFVFASIVKIKSLRFTAESGAENPINSAWHFFETLYQSGTYWNFIGWSQLTAGFLLLTQRYSKLGAVLFLPIIANVFFITISYDFNGTPIITGLMLLATILLLVWDWDSLKILINRTPKLEHKERLENDVLWEIIGFIIFLIAVVPKLTITEDNFKFIFGALLITLPSIGIIGFVLGWRKRKQYYEIN